MSRGNRPPLKDMYWFAHGGTESENPSSQRNTSQAEDDEVITSNSPSWNLSTDRKGSPDESRGLLVTDGSNSSGPPSLERDDRLRTFDKRLAAEERRKQLLEAEQERNDAVLRKHMEREAALEARRNAQRSNISFAFGSSIPRNVETLYVNEGGDTDVMSRSFTTSGLSQKEENHDYYRLDRRSVSPLNYNGYSLVDGVSHQSDSSHSYSGYSERKVLPPPSWLSGSGALIGEDVMSRSMSASMSAPRGRRKNDLMPTVPYERTPPARAATSSSTRKRSVSMTRLDQLALPRRHYVEANKTSSTASSGASSVMKDHIRSPTRPLSSASEHSGGSGRAPTTVNRRVRSSPRKPRPVSIAGTLPDHKPINNVKSFEVKVSPVKRSYTPSKRTAEISEPQKSTQPPAKNSTPKPIEKAKPAPRPSTATKSSTPKVSSKPTVPKAGSPKPNTTKSSASKSTTPKATKQVESKPSAPKTSTTKVAERKSQPVKKKGDTVVASPVTGELKEKTDAEKQDENSTSQDNDTAVENEKNNAKRIISEEEAKAALAEKRRLAREQAEREAELERQRQEQLRLEEEERLRKEEEEHRKMEEEQIRLLEEHRRQEEEKLRKAIEDQEQKEEEERAKRDEELRMKAEQERKAKEEAEKQRFELEEKLRKEEEERAERKKRLEKIMSRTRGKSSGTSPSGSVSGSEQLDSAENAQEGFSSGANSLDSNEAGDIPSEQVSSVEDHKAEISSAGNSMEANPTYDIGSENESLNSNELMMPSSETASQDNSLIIIPDKSDASVESDTISCKVPPVTEGPQVEPASAMQIPAGDAVISSDPEFKLSTDDEMKQQTLDAVQKQNEMTVDVLETEPIGRSEAVETAAVASLSENLISPNIFESEQYSDNDAGFEAIRNEAEAAAVGNETLMSESELIGEIETAQELTEVTPQYIENKYNRASDETSNVNDELYSDNTEFMLPEPSSMPSNMSFSADVNDARAPETSEDRQVSSVSSDIKLPDPIYETSDEGSISSDKHQQFGHQEDGSYTANQENIVSDDVFSEQAVLSKSESAYQFSNSFVSDAFSKHQNPFSADGSEYIVPRSMPSDNQFRDNFEDGSEYVVPSSMPSDNQFSNNFEETDGYNFSENMYQDKLLDSLEQPREIEEENVILSRSSTSSVIEADVHLSESVVKESDVFYHDIQENKENQSNEITSTNSSTEAPDYFANEDIITLNAYDACSNKENLISAIETNNVYEALESEDGKLNSGATNDNPFVGNPFSGNSGLHAFQPQEHDFYIDQQHSSAASEQIGNFETRTIDTELPSQGEQVSDVTFIKSDDSGACIGIISSVDHDHSVNDFPKPSLHSEQLKSNFEYASMTDSEENSSLDSNLSQVMNVEHSEKDTVGGLNHTENSVMVSNVNQSVFSNGQQNNPFEMEHINNYDINSKSSVNNFSATEISNGHSLESSKQVSDQVDELHGYGQVDGNGILSVDHPKNNIFENVDAIDYGKVSPDPFLAKGNSKQISGNPFLLQDDQKQVLMTPDFLN